MRNYLVIFGPGVRRNIIASSAFDAIRTALGTLTLVDQLLISVSDIRITCKPEPL